VTDPSAQYLTLSVQEIDRSIPHACRHSGPNHVAHHKLPHYFKQLRTRLTFTQFTLPNEIREGRPYTKIVPAEGFEPPTTRLRSTGRSRQLKGLVAKLRWNSPKFCFKFVKS